LYTVRAFRHAAIPACPGPQIFYLSRFSEWLPVVGYFWLIRGEGRTILVDTGIRDVDECNAASAPPPTPQSVWVQTAAEKPLVQLRAAGVEPEQVDAVILTHLHYDHASNVHLFPNATVYVNRRGWLYAMDPAHKLHPLMFPRDTLAYLAGEAWERLHLCDDEEEILPGIGVFWVGAHTECSQAVRIETNLGRVVLAGDVVMYQENLSLGHPPGLIKDLDQAHEALRRCLQAGDLVLPGHDPRLLERYPNGVIA